MNDPIFQKFVKENIVTELTGEEYRKMLERQYDDMLREQRAKAGGDYVAPVQNWYDSQYRRAQQLLDSKAAPGLIGQLTEDDIRRNQEIDDEVNRIYTDMHKYNPDGTLINPEPEGEDKKRGLKDFAKRLFFK